MINKNKEIILNNKQENALLKQEGGKMEKKDEIFERLKISAQNILKSFELKSSKDNLLVVVEADVDESVRNAFYEASRDLFGSEARMMVISNLQTSGAPISKEAGKKMLFASNLLLLGIRSMSHSSATKEAWLAHPERVKVLKDLEKRKKVLSTLGLKSSAVENNEILMLWKKLMPKANIISIPDARKESFLHKCYEVEKEEIIKKAEKIKELFKQTRKAHIFSPNGTNLWVDIDAKKYPVLVESPVLKRDELGFMNSPAGETAILPTNVNGQFVIDGFCADVELEVKNKEVINPIIVNFENGVAKIKPNSKEAEQLIALCESARQASIKAGKEYNPYEIAEFAIGVLGKPDSNGKIDFTLNNATIDEKLTLHLAIGKNDMLGGENLAPIHIDFGGQNIFVDLFRDKQGKEKLFSVLKNGNLMIDKEGKLIK